MIWIKYETINPEVTDYYLSIIRSVFENEGYKTVSIHDWKEAKVRKNDVVVVSTAIDAIKFRFQKVKMIFWAQGIWPEESFLRNSNKIRYIITSFIEKKAIKRADFLFLVSDSMRIHYERKYNLKITENYYIMPCSNEEMHNDSFNSLTKYTNNVFCYAGGTSLWQCIEETIELYSKIEKNHPDSKLLLLVKDKNFVKNLVDKYNVKNYEIDFVSVEELKKRLKEVKFGFLIRKDCDINRVATPTKLMTYLSNGIIPIYSSCLTGISEILFECKYKICYNNDGNISDIENMMSNTICTDKISKDFNQVYLTSYDIKNNEEKINKEFKKSKLI